MSYKVIRLQEILERNLSFGDLNLEFNGRKRGDILLNKIARKEPIQIKKNNQSKEVTISRLKDYSTGQEIPNEQIPNIFKSWDNNRMRRIFLKPPHDRHYTSSLISDTGEEFKLNDVVKTGEYGRLSGSSLGSESTDEVESIIIFSIAARQLFGKEIENIDQLKNILDNPLQRELIFSNILTKKIVTSELIDKYPDWGTTFTIMVNEIFRPDNYIITNQNLKKKLETQPLFRDKQYTFHHFSSQNSDIIQTLKKKYSDFRTGININKWIPCDVWAITNSSQDFEFVKTEINRCNTLDQLKVKLDNFFDNRTFIGISLKKVSGRPKIIINQETTVPTITFDKVRTDRNKSIQSQDTKFETYLNLGGIIEEATWVFRVFSSREQDGLGEILGADSRFGKISLAIINQIFRSLDMDQVPTYTTLREMTKEEIEEKIKIISERLFNELGVGDMGRYISDYNSSPRDDGSKKRRISKYQGLCIAQIFLQNILDNKIEKVDKANQMILHYAYSIDTSLDPQRERPNTPKYIRVIE